MAKILVCTPVHCQPLQIVVPEFGNKNHLNVDRRHGLIRQ